MLSISSISSNVPLGKSSFRSVSTEEMFDCSDTTLHLVCIGIAKRPIGMSLVIQLYRHASETNCETCLYCIWCHHYYYIGYFEVLLIWLLVSSSVWYIFNVMTFMIVTCLLVGIIESMSQLSLICQEHCLVMESTPSNVWLELKLHEWTQFSIQSILLLVLSCLTLLWMRLDWRNGKSLKIDIKQCIGVAMDAMIGVVCVVRHPVWDGHPRLVLWSLGGKFLLDFAISCFLNYTTVVFAFYFFVYFTS